MIPLPEDWLFVLYVKSLVKLQGKSSFYASESKDISLSLRMILKGECGETVYQVEDL